MIAEVSGHSKPEFAEHIGIMTMCLQRIGLNVTSRHLDFNFDGIAAGPQYHHIGLVPQHAMAQVRDDNVLPKIEMLCYGEFDVG